MSSQQTVWPLHTLLVMRDVDHVARRCISPAERKLEIILRGTIDPIGMIIRRKVYIPSDPESYELVL